MSFEQAVPYVAAVYAVILVAILAWAALVARRTARLRRRLDDLERAVRRHETASAQTATPHPPAAGTRAAGGHESGT